MKLSPRSDPHLGSMRLMPAAAPRSKQRSLDRIADVILIGDGPTRIVHDLVVPKKAPPPPPVPPASAAAQLSAGRRKRRVSLGYVARVTRIKEDYLAAIEANAPVSAFPAPFYARAFIREYATFLQMNPDDVVAKSPAAHALTDPTETLLSIPVPERIPPRPRRWLIPRAVAFVLVVFAIGRTSPHAAVVKTTARAATAVLPTSTASTTAAARSFPASAMIWLNVSALKTAWGRVIVDGQPQFDGTMLAGEVRGFTATATIDFIIDDASSVRATIDGHSLGTLGTIGQARVVHVARNSERVLVVGA